MYFNGHEYLNQLEEKYVNKAVNDAVRLASGLAARLATRLVLCLRKRPSIYNKICNLLKNKGEVIFHLSSNSCNQVQSFSAPADRKYVQTTSLAELY